MPEAIFVLYPFSSSKSDIISPRIYCSLKGITPITTVLSRGGAVPMQPAIMTNTATVTQTRGRDFIEILNIANFRALY